MKKKTTITNVLLAVSLVFQLVLIMSMNKELKILNTITEYDDTNDEISIIDEYLNKEDKTRNGMVTIVNKDYYEMINDLQSFISSGKYSDYCKYGESLEIIDVEYQYYYTTVLGGSDKVLIWQATVIFKYQDGDVEYGIQE